MSSLLVVEMLDRNRPTLARRGDRPLITAVTLAALASEPPLYACNPDDFAGIDGLDVVPVRVPE